MQKLLSFLKWADPIIRFALLALAMILIVTNHRENSASLALLLVIVLLLIVIDLGRFHFYPVKGHPAVYALVSMCLCILVMLTNNNADYIQVYYFFLLDSLFNMQNGKTRKCLIIAHFSGFMGLKFYTLFFVERRNIDQAVESIFYLACGYAVILLIFATVHYFKFERDRLKLLNSNLIEYSFEEREYLIAKERSNISQELHDSLGHSLMAVLMNVRYLKAIPEKSQNEKDKQIDEIESLLKDCVASLRGSVYSLKKLDENINLKEEIERIIHKFEELNLIKIQFDYDDEIDNVPNRVKSVLHKTIREGITNSIRHGDATKIYLSIRCSVSNIELVVRDNGSGCADIHKSFGLNGIVERVREAGGEVYFISAKNKGFTIKVVLPGGNEI